MVGNCDESSEWSEKFLFCELASVASERRIKVCISNNLILNTVNGSNLVKDSSISQVKNSVSKTDDISHSTEPCIRRIIL